MFIIVARIINWKLNNGLVTWSQVTGKFSKRVGDKILSSSSAEEL